MGVCESCGSTYQTTYCENCGTLAPDRQAHKASIGSSILVGAMLLFIVGLGASYRYSAQHQPAAKPAPPVAQAPPDDLARIVQKCGNADADTTSALKMKRGAAPTRTLLYRKTGIKLVFKAKPTTAPQQWAFDSAKSSKSNKVLSKDQLTKRMSCVVQ